MLMDVRFKKLAEQARFERQRMPTERLIRSAAKSAYLLLSLEVKRAPEEMVKFSRQNFNSCLMEMYGRFFEAFREIKLKQEAVNKDWDKSSGEIMKLSSKQLKEFDDTPIETLLMKEKNRDGE